MYLNVNFNVFVKIIKVHLLVSELYICHIKLHFFALKLLRVRTVSIKTEYSGLSSRSNNPV